MIMSRIARNLRERDNTAGAAMAESARLDRGGEPPDDGRMEQRVARLEADVSAIKIDVAIILSNYATKNDIETLRVELGAVRSDIHKSAVETHKWMLATVIGLFIGFGGLFLAMSNALKPASPAAPPTPAGIAAPAAPASSPPH